MFFPVSCKCLFYNKDKLLLIQAKKISNPKSFIAKYYNFLRIKVPIEILFPYNSFVSSSQTSCC